ncbi:MAG: hypothetical protein CEE38_07775 [Planctomycetes bacterium B3_Pla]|nr:MAG: hypothetical protein CEE38_07775 [Planctomycetes bacterium B3_Pla]
MNQDGAVYAEVTALCRVGLAPPLLIGGPRPTLHAIIAVTAGVNAFLGDAKRNFMFLSSSDIVQHLLGSEGHIYRFRVFKFFFVCFYTAVESLFSFNLIHC